MTVALAAGLSQTSLRQLEQTTGVDHSRIAYAMTVRHHSPDLTDGVLSGAMTLDAAYAVARERKTEADSLATRLATLDADAPDLASHVRDDTLTAGEAWAAWKDRETKARSQRRRTTSDFAESVVMLWTLLQGEDDEIGRTVVAHWERNQIDLYVTPDIFHAEGLREVMRRLGVMADLLDAEHDGTLPRPTPDE